MVAHFYDDGAVTIGGGMSIYLIISTQHGKIWTKSLDFRYNSILSYLILSMYQITTYYTVPDEGIYYYVPDEGKYYFAPDEVQARWSGARQQWIPKYNFTLE